MSKTVLTLFLVICASVFSTAQKQDIWYRNVDDAVNVAIKEDKKVMLFFTGSDWCGWCIRLQKEVFETSDFKKWANNFILVELDFPRRTPQEENIKQQNSQMQAMFKVRGYPSIYFVKPEKTSEGKINFRNLGRTGYIKGGVTKWLEAANTIVKGTL